MSVAECRHCHRRYDVTDDLRKGDACCPWCGRLLRRQVFRLGNPELEYEVIETELSE